MRGTLAILSALLLTACVGSPARPIDIARHDFGDPPGQRVFSGISVVRIDVRAAAGLDSPAQLYRLTYADALRRHGYAESRWVAPPGELLEGFLQRRMLAGQPAPGAGAGCRLVLWLDAGAQLVRFQFDDRAVSGRSTQITIGVGHGMAL